jgi:hypothetical protein
MRFDQPRQWVGRAAAPLASIVRERRVTSPSGILGTE